LSLKEEWTEGLDAFLKIASKEKYSNPGIWSSANDLLERIYPRKDLNSDRRRAKNRLLLLIALCLVTIETTLL